MILEGIIGIAGLARFMINPEILKAVFVIPGSWSPVSLESSSSRVSVSGGRALFAFRDALERVFLCFVVKAEFDDSYSSAWYDYESVKILTRDSTFRRILFQRVWRMTSSALYACSLSQVIG